MPTTQKSNYSVTCDKVTGICTAKLKIPPAGRAYEIPAERRGKLVDERLKAASKNGESAEYLGYGLNIESREVDEGRRTILFVCSTAAIDRYGDIIMQDGWQLDNYLRNPVVLWGHDSRSLPIGKSQKTAVDKGKLVALIEFATGDVYEFADTVFRMVAKGFVNTLSVGFMPIEWEWRRGEPDPEQGDFQPILGRIYTKQELLENSVVSVPANPEALVVGRGFEEAIKAIELDETAPDYSAAEKEFANRKTEPCVFAEPCERAYFTIRRKGVMRHGSINPVDTKDVDAAPFALIASDLFETISLSTEEKAEAEAVERVEADKEIKEAFLAELVGADIDGRPVYCANVRIERNADSIGGLTRAGSGKKTQTVIFSKKVWTLARAKKWCSSHSLKTSDPQHTDSSYRFRQFSPSQCKDGTYETLTENMPKGLSLGVCNKKSSKGVGEPAASGPSEKNVPCNCKKEDDARKLAAALENIFPCQEAKMGKIETKRRLEKIKKHVHAAREQMHAMHSECVEGLDQACDYADAVVDSMSKAFLLVLAESEEDPADDLGEETVGDKIRAMHKCMKECRADANRGITAYKGYVSRAISHLRAVCSAMGDTLDKDDPMEGTEQPFPPKVDETDDPSNPADDPTDTNGPGKSLDDLLNEAQITATSDGASPSINKDAPPASAENELEDFLLRAVSETQV